MGHEKIVDVVTLLLRRRLPITNEMVSNLVKIELSYINTKHPDFSDAGLVDTLINVKNEAQQMLMDASGDPRKSQSKVQGQEVALNGPMSNGPSSMVSSSSSSPSVSGFKGGSLIPDMTSMAPQRKLTGRERRDVEIIQRLIKNYFLIVRKNIQDSVPKAIMHFLVNHVRDSIQSELVSKLYKSDGAGSLLNESKEMSQRRQEAQEMLAALQKASQIISEVRETQLW